MRAPFGTLDVSNPREVWLVTGAHAVNEFYSVALPPILPLLVADFDITYGQAGALLTVFYVMYSIFQLPAGRLADRIGQRTLLSGGMVVLAIGVLLAGVARDYPMLVAAQALAGIGGSTYHPSGMSIISDLETGGTEGRAMGIHGLGGVTGTALAPALIGGLAVAFDWRFALLAAAVVGIGYGIIFAALFSRPEEPTLDADGGRPEPSDGDPDRTAGVASQSTGLHAMVQRVLNVPLAWWVAGLFLANFLISFETVAIRTFAPSYLFERTGESTGISNGVYFVMLVGGGISSIGAGYLADRFDRVRLGGLVLFLSAVGLALTPVLPPATPVLVGWFFLLGMIVYAIFPAMNALTSSYSDRSFSGSLFGVMLTAGSLGSAVGPLVFGVAADRLGVTVAFPAIGTVSVLGVGAFLLLSRL